MGAKIVILGLEAPRVDDPLHHLTLRRRGVRDDHLPLIGDVTEIDMILTTVGETITRTVIETGSVNATGTGIEIDGGITNPILRARIGIGMATGDAIVRQNGTEIRAVVVETTD